ncbi:MAG: hypothetical protein ACI8S6_000889 [Myxococcota bacterium]|jgi:hypothetical protein
MITFFFLFACAGTPAPPEPPPTAAPTPPPAAAPTAGPHEAARAYAAEIDAGRSGLFAVEGPREEGGDAVIRVVGHRQDEDLVLIEEIVEVGEYRSTVQRLYLRAGQPVLARHSGMETDPIEGSDDRFRYFEEVVIFAGGAPVVSQKREVFNASGHAPTPPDLSVLPWETSDQPFEVDVAGLIANFPQQ